MINIVVTEDDGRTTRFNNVIDLAFYAVGIEGKMVLNIRFGGMSNSQIDLYRIKTIEFLKRQ